MLTRNSTKCRYDVRPGLTGMITENATFTTCGRLDKGVMRLMEQGVG